MAHDVLMPQMGESIAEGTVTTWLKKVGERVERDQPLFEVATDKVDAEIPSPASGVLVEIRAQPGTTVPINAVVAVIAAEGEQPAAGEAAAPAPAAPTSAPAAAPGHSSAAGRAVQDVPASQLPDQAPHGPVVSAGPASPAPQASASHQAQTPAAKSSPLVRKIAQEHEVDLNAVRGTGSGGRITKDDILAHVDGGASAAPAASASAGHAAPTHVAGAAPSAPPAPAPGGGSGRSLPGPDEVPENYRARAFDGDRVEDLGGMRSKIAEHMVLSKRISPHVGTVWEMDFGHVAALRARHKKAWEERYGVNLTYTTFILKAAVDALKAFPVCNASLDGNKVIYHRSVNLGVAVSLDWGLIVPVVHGADELNLLGLARRAQDLATRARSKKLKPNEVQAGTFTVTNPGGLGPMFNLPIINQPQVAIMGVGTVEKRPVVINDAIAIRTRAYLSLSFDHRLVDGAVADQFMGHVKKNLEAFDEGEL